ncbi:MAG: dUTP diphosphatase [Flavobacteriales bacterium]|nr:dUTP diphosphatase [Flavobacteriales bacterium]
MENLKVKVINKSQNKLPKYETPGSAGMDVRSNEDYTLKTERRTLISTGLFFEIPEGYEMQVRPRSGMANKYGITVLNAPGTIDSDYRGELGVILYNSGQTAFEIKKGDRIAQLVLAPVTRFEFEVAEDLSESDREGGFGSTGNN